MYACPRLKSVYLTQEIKSLEWLKGVVARIPFKAFLLDMSKRFIDDSIHDYSFRKLNSSLKLAWYYLWNSCDASGVWKIDNEMFRFENGFDFPRETFLSSFKDRIQVCDDLILLVDFIEVNYVKLKPEYNPHKPAFRAISKNNLQFSKSLNKAYFKLETKLEDEEEDEEEDEDTFERGVGKNFKPDPISGTLIFGNPQLTDQVFDSEQWAMNLARLQNQTVEQIRILFAEEFLPQKLQTSGESRMKLKEIRRYFANWLNKRNSVPNDPDKQTINWESL